jgi:hypothetical protein
MLTFKQWLVRQYGTTKLNITPKTLTKVSNTVPAKTSANNS